MSYFYTQKAGSIPVTTLGWRVCMSGGDELYFSGSKARLSLENAIKNSCEEVPRLKKRQNELARKLAVAVRDHRGAVWEETIDNESDSMKNLHQLNRRLTKTTIPIARLQVEQEHAAMTL
ncbi:hypothetical protein EVAR_64505_1 [Eumeta japonica]|uniref:Uncharacterized protein n=1 Tax=Eumeta variegata TaxID=151549 RepID=A0A4C1Z416_EUMVA|nr:hypothetical protein EVAR_64505_1 [Eumeta japonica]